MIALSYMPGHLFKFQKMCFGQKVRLEILFIEFHTKVTGRPAAGKSLERLSGRHFLRKIVATKTVCRLCIVCSKACRQAEGRKRPGRQTSYECAMWHCAQSHASRFTTPSRTMYQPITYRLVPVHSPAWCGNSIRGYKASPLRSELASLLNCPHLIRIYNLLTLIK